MSKIYSLIGIVAVLVVGSFFLLGNGTNTITTVAPLKPPGSLTAQAVSQNQINLSWTDTNTLEGGYEVYRSLKNGSGFTLIATAPQDSTSYQDTKLNASTTYYYRARAVSGGSHSTYSNVASATTFVTPPPLVASCSVSPTAILTGGSATWTASQSGGTGSYAWSWSGTDGLTGTTTQVTKTYTLTGTKTASVTVTSGTQTQAPTCSNSLTVSAPPPPPPPPISGSCWSNPTIVNTGQNMTWISSVSGGTGSYTYNWAFSDGTSASTASVSKSYSTVGEKYANVIVNSGTQSNQFVCSPALQVVLPPPPPLPPPADLSVPSTSYAPTSTRNGNLMSFSGVIKNYGSSTASSSEASLMIDINYNGSWDVIVNQITPALAPGESQTVVWSNAWTAITGTHRFEICADVTGIVPESNENNCSSIKGFSVSPVGSPPQANAGPSHLLTASTTHTHDGASAIDPDGNLSSYEWSLWKCYFVSTNSSTTCPILSNALGSLSGGTATTSVPGPSFTPLTNGTNYKLLLKVWDIAGWAASSTVEEGTP